MEKIAGTELISASLLSFLLFIIDRNFTINRNVINVDGFNPKSDIHVVNAKSIQ